MPDEELAEVLDRTYELLKPKTLNYAEEFGYDMPLPQNQRLRDRASMNKEESKKRIMNNLDYAARFGSKSTYDPYDESEWSTILKEEQSLRKNMKNENT